jgi:hypothetical protein
VADPADPKSSETASASADIPVLRFVSKLGDTADDDGIEAKDLADPRRRGRIGAVTVGKILFREDFVELFALDDAVRPVRHQILH